MYSVIRKLADWTTQDLVRLEEKRIILLKKIIMIPFSKTVNNYYESITCNWKIDYAVLLLILHLIIIIKIKFGERRYYIVTSLKNKIENNSTWDGLFYQSKWVKINSSRVFSVFHFMYVAVNAPNCFLCYIQLKILNAFFTILTFILNIKFYVQVNLPAWAYENQLKCKKMRFLSKMSEINSWWFIFKLSDWTIFKSVHFWLVYWNYMPLVSFNSTLLPDFFFLNDKIMKTIFCNFFLLHNA